MLVERVDTLNVHFNELTGGKLICGHCILQLNNRCLFQMLEGISLFQVRHNSFLFIVAVKSASKAKLSLANVLIIHYSRDIV